MSARREAGFSLVEVSVGLTIISLGVMGTLSLISANRALAEAAWTETRLTSVSRSVLDNVEMRYLTGDDFSSFDGTPTYSWSTDSFSLQSLFVDNALTAADSTLTIASSTDANTDYTVTLDLVSPQGRRLEATRKLRTRFD